MKRKLTLTALLIWSTLCTASQSLYTSASIDVEGQLQLTTETGAVVFAPTYPGPIEDAMTQVEYSDPQISEDRKTVGWLALYYNCCQSYPIPLQLVIFSNGKVVRAFEGIPPIWAWTFEIGATRVAFVQRPMHGSSVDHYELRDVKTGALIAEYDQGEEESKDGMPSWAAQLKY